MKAVGITVVGASAGSGKTFRLTHEVLSALVPETASGVPSLDVEGLVAVTFTRKAHAELEARIRRELVKHEAFEASLRLPLAYVGTVHAVALRLLDEFAIDAGLSPNVDVVAGNETKLLREAFEQTLDHAARTRLDELAARLELRVAPQTRRNDWVTPVADIMDLARANRISPDDLPRMAETSVARLLALLPGPSSDEHGLEAALARELEVASRALRAAGDTHRNTAEVHAAIDAALRKLADGELRWSDWAKLSTLAPARGVDACVRELRLAASRYEEHPRLHADLKETTGAIFEAARAGLVAYQQWKRERRVIDYVDMLDGALDLLDQQRVRQELERRLSLIVVDEFQDTSPIQLAFFVRLHAVAQRSVWVGDRKQCIFEYAGADPVLMDAVAAWVERAGGVRDRLDTNRRSRPELVEACSELFAEALAHHGFDRTEVAVAPHREALSSHTTLPPLGLFLLESPNAGSDAVAIARGVRRLLDAPLETPVLDKITGDVRPLRPGDVAVLVATNDAASAVADALHACGLRCSVARAGLFATPEGTLAEAALRWLIDESDSLAEAIVDALTGWRGGDPDGWLEMRLRESAHREDEPRDGWRAQLASVRSRLGVLSPAEALDATLFALDAARRCAQWPDPAQRIANLDALQSAAREYEKRCGQEREAATVAGMLRWFDALRTPSLQRDEIVGSDDQHAPSDDGAVIVCTYHKSKGLEWPVVVLAQLDRRERRNAFEVSPESVGGAFDPERPLANRSIRYWPWPLGATKNAPLAARAEASSEGREVALREEKERARLLYVGFTRARDHLILAARVARGKAKTHWLDALANARGTPLVKLPIAAEDDTTASTEVGALRVPTRVMRVGSAPDAIIRAANEQPPTTWFARPPNPSRAVVPYRIVPSAGTDDWPELTARVAACSVGTIQRLASAIDVVGDDHDDDVLGNVVHGFFASDVAGLSEEERLSRAKRLIEGASITNVLQPESLLRAGDELRAWVKALWPDATWHRELPIEGYVASEDGERRVSGIIDLLLETREGGVVLIDHKTFPAKSEAAWRAKCPSFVPQLAAYALLLEASGRAVVAACIHLPVGGGLVNLTFDRAR